MENTFPRSFEDMGKIAQRLKLAGRYCKVCDDCNMTVLHKKFENGYKYDVYHRFGDLLGSYDRVDVYDKAIVCYKIKYKCSLDVFYDDYYVYELYLVHNDRLVRFKPRMAFKRFTYATLKDMTAIHIGGRKDFIIKPDTMQFVELDNGDIQKIDIDDSDKRYGPQIRVFLSSWLKSYGSVSYDFKSCSDGCIKDIRKIEKIV